jgi:hypothetical protein
VTYVGITGHRVFDESTTRLIAKALRDALQGYEPTDLVGVTNLAEGADALFAQAVLDHGGTIEVIVPAAKYLDSFPDEYHDIYHELLSHAAAVRRLDFQESNSEAHMAASEYMIARVSKLLAVWDGQPARGYGGTADVVEAARKINVPVQVIWPEGAHRD